MRPGGIVPVRGHAIAAALGGLLGLLIAGPGSAELRVESTAQADPAVALFVSHTVTDLPGGASVPVRLEIQCRGGDIHYLVVDFATPRLGRETATLETRIEQHFADTAGDLTGRWRVHYDVLAGRDQAAVEHDDLANLQLDRMVYLDSARNWLERATGADYVALEQPARGNGQFVFELSHVDGELRELASHCGL